MFPNGLNMSLPQQTWVENTVHEVKTQRFSSKVPGTTASKEGHAVTVFWNMKGTITITAMVNNASYCHVLEQNSPYLLNSPWKIFLSAYFIKSDRQGFDA